jgi:hypothetical protein
VISFSPTEAYIEQIAGWQNAKSITARDRSREVAEQQPAIRRERPSASGRL